METSSSKIGRVLAIILVAAAVACSWLPSIQNLADEQVDASLKRALVAFAAAKTLNAVISVVQGTEVSAQFGVGTTLTPGQLLDPINDLVEQFASLMLTASVAFGVQKALLAIGAHWLISAAVTGFALAWALLHFRGRAPLWLSRALFVLVMVRFAIPVITIGSDWVFHRFLSQKYQAAQQSIDVVTAKVDAPNPANKGWIDKLTELFKSPADWLGRIGELKKATEEMSDQIIRLMVVFVMQTLILPLVFLWALLKVAGGVLLARPAPRRTSVPST